MPLGILEDHKLDHVPGTSPLSEVGTGNIESSLPGLVDSRLLKHDPSGEIILVPQPSDSPNDPYNWPRWKKEMFTLAFAVGCGAVGACGPLIAAAAVPLADELGVSLQTFTTGFQGACIVGIGVGSLICNPLAVKIGKRPVYIASTIGLIVTCFWGASAGSFGSLAASRAIQGICMAPLEALVPASIADVWFVHERGYRMSIFNLGVLGGINLAPPIGGSVIESSDYQTCLRGMGGAWILFLILTIFFMPETSYDRSLNAIDIDTWTDADRVTNALEKKFGGAEKNDATTQTQAVPASINAEPRKPWLRELLPWDGYWGKDSFLTTFLSPFYVATSPVVLWGTLLFTTCISWLVLIGITLSQIFSGPPYNFSVSSVGATNVSAFVASVIGTLVASPIIDGVVRLMAKRNNGIFEPEFRLPVMFAYLLITAPGFFAWGYSLSNGDPWPIPVVVCLGLINFGIQLGTTGVVTYVVDCHRTQAEQAFAFMTLVKNFFAFGLSFYCNDWIAVQGVRNCFFVIGGITAAVSLLTVPMYVWGKRARSFAARHRIGK